MSQIFTIFDRSTPRNLYQQAWISVDLTSKIQLPGVLRVAHDPGDPLVGARIEPNNDTLPCNRRGVELATVSSTTQRRMDALGRNSRRVNSPPWPVIPMNSAFFGAGIVSAFAGAGGRS